MAITWPLTADLDNLMINLSTPSSFPIIISLNHSSSYTSLQLDSSSAWSPDHWVVKPLTSNCLWLFSQQASISTAMPQISPFPGGHLLKGRGRRSG